RARAPGGVRSDARARRRRRRQRGGLDALRRQRRGVRRDRGAGLRDRGRDRADAGMSAVRTKRIYAPSSPDDGVRVLVMRLWPRGIKKTAIDLWLKDLGADVANLRAWKAGKLDWPEMRRRYVAGLEQPPAAAALTELRTLASKRKVTLLCSCEEESHCH